MTPPKNDLVIEDCDAALRLDPKYIKALNRRAMALEGLGRLEEALRGEYPNYLLLKWPIKSFYFIYQTSPPRPFLTNSKIRQRPTRWREF